MSISDFKHKRAPGLGDAILDECPRDCNLTPNWREPRALLHLGDAEPTLGREVFEVSGLE